MVSYFSWTKNPPEEVLRERFHITTGFHADQRKIIELLVQGKRVLAIQRTGWGKSLCYQMASLYYPHLTLVFSPLKALMRDQCQRCNDSYNLPSAIISSDFTEEENRTTLAKVVGGQIKILFIAPERLDNIDWQSNVRQMRISMIIIDEAHCISTWGHDFRPNYRRIVRLLDAIPSDIPVLALTATANTRVESDILEQIGRVALIVRGTMQRPNLWSHVVSCSGDKEKLAYLATILPQWQGTGIIYTATRHDAEMVAEFLCTEGIDAAYYHAGREDSVRQTIEQQLMQNRCKVVCTTNALGMGIDKPDTRFVIHYHIPPSPIHYYQEMGRAGRDGKIARCVLLYDPTDLNIQKHFISNAKPAAKYYQRIFDLLKATPYTKRDLMMKTGYSQNTVAAILTDLEDQHIIEPVIIGRKKAHHIIGQLDQTTLATYDIVQQQKQQELQEIQQYALLQNCYMGYLTAYLGDAHGYHCGTCGQCNSAHFPFPVLTQRIYERVQYFLEESFLPRIEKRGEKQPIHEAGWSLSYHGTTRFGQLVRASKYEGAGSFPKEIVQRAVKVIRERYPLDTIDGIVSVPSTKSGMLVETFARSVANELQTNYLVVLQKIRVTGEQKSFTNWVQKANNVKDAFIVSAPRLISGRTLLLIDDIYDSGYTLREVTQTLMRAGAKQIYPFTITKTQHSDDQ